MISQLMGWPGCRDAALDYEVPGHGFGFYIALTVRDEGKGIRAIRIDPELVSEWTSLGHLNRNETKIASTITRDAACR
jgi:hypothetical protein